VLLTLLSNCCVDKPTRDGCRSVLAPGRPAAGCVRALLALPAGGAAGPVLGRALALLTNLAGDAPLRQSVLLEDGMLAAVAAVACSATRGALTAAGVAAAAGAGGRGAARAAAGAGACCGTAVAALTLMYNLAVDPPAQAAGGSAGPLVAALVDAMAAGAKAPDHQPPCPTEGAPVGGPTDAFGGLAGVAARAAGLASRLAKDAAGARALEGAGVVQAAVALAARSLDGLAAAAAATGAAGEGGVEGAAATGREPHAFAADACVRTLTLLVAGGGEHAGAALDAMLEAGGLAVLLRALGAPAATASPSTDDDRDPALASRAAVAVPAAAPAPAGALLPESVLGNAALAVAAVAKDPARLPLLAAADAVGPLVRVAYEGRGNTASKNAAIALARMAHDPRMLERLRELNGIEIIYRYVKP
jgi:hypothetical protein